MKNKICLVFGILLLCAGSVWSQKPTDIPIIKLPSDSIDKPKSPISSPIPLVTLDGTELTFAFSPATASQIVIMDENDQCQVVYNESFTSSTQIFVD